MRFTTLLATLACASVPAGPSCVAQADERPPTTPVRVLSDPMPLPGRDLPYPAPSRKPAAYDDVFCLAFSPDGRYFAAGGARTNTHDEVNGSTRIWSLGKGAARKPRALIGRDDAVVNAIAFAPGRNEILCAGCTLGARTTGFVEFWDVATGRAKNRIAYEKEAVSSLVISPDSKWLAVGMSGPESAVRIMDVAKHQEIALLRGKGDGVTSLGYSPDGSFLLSSEACGLVRVWNTVTRHAMREFQPKGQRTIMAVSPSSKEHVAAITAGNVMNGIGNDDVCIWNYQTGERIRTLEGHIQAIASIAFSPDGKLLVTGGTTTILADGKAPLRALSDTSAQLLVWDVGSGKVLSSIEGHVGEVRAIAFSPSGELFGTVDSISRAIRLWASPRPLAASSAIR